MTTWLLAPRSGATFTNAAGNVYTGTVGVPVSFADADVTAALAQGWTYSLTAPLDQLGQLIPITDAPLVYHAIPNITLTNAIGTTSTQAAFVTIPSGAMTPTSQIEILALYTKVGTTTMDAQIRFGATSGSWSSALLIGGQSGLTSQQSIGVSPVIINQGSLSSQLCTVSGQANHIGTNGATMTAANVDTSLDFNIYFGAQYTVAPAGGDTITLRAYRITIWS